MAINYQLNTIEMECMAEIEAIRICPEVGMGIKPVDLTRNPFSKTPEICFCNVSLELVGPAFVSVGVCVLSGRLNLPSKDQRYEFTLTASLGFGKAFSLRITHSVSFCMDSISQNIPESQKHCGESNSSVRSNKRQSTFPSAKSESRILAIHNYFWH